MLRTLGILICTICATQAQAWDLIELGNIDLESKASLGESNLYLLNQENLNNLTKLNIDLIIFGGAHFKTTFLSGAQNFNQRVVGVGLEYGIYWTDWLETAYYNTKLNAVNFQDASAPNGWKEEGIIFRIRFHKGARADAVYQ